MHADVIRFQFDADTSLDDVEMTLHLAMFAVEGVFGRARVRLDAEYELDEEHNAIDIDTNTEVGAIIVRVFTGLLLRELGEESFQIQRATLDRTPTEAERTVCA